MLTEYPVIGALPALTDYLWYPVHKMGDRLLALKPERMLSHPRLHGWWRRVEKRRASATASRT